MFIMMTFWWSVYNDDFPFTTSKTKRDNRVIYAGCLTSCRATKDLRLYEIRKNQENLKTPKNYCPAPSRNPLPPQRKPEPPSNIPWMAVASWVSRKQEFKEIAFSRNHHSLLEYSLWKWCSKISCWQCSLPFALLFFAN